MKTNVITTTPETQVAEIAKLLLEHHISAVPVVDADNRVLGIVSEGDLIHRPELGGRRRRSWWLSFLTGDEELTQEYLKTHGSRAAEVMTRPAVTVTEDTSIGQIAQLLEKRRIKRVPVVQDGKLVGMVSRADLLQGLAVAKDREEEAPSLDDRAIREKLLATLQKEGIPDNYVNVVVTDGVVHLWGLVRSEQEQQALHLAAEQTPGVKAVEDHLGKIHPGTLSD
ncbi:MAG: CBS domain-containing protein [Candidatus Competibacteraceae bacterium]|nr:CBS domain-containing protein [Candidatus Competibacteraceae bacterium]